MGKGGMGMVGTNFSEGVKKHYNPKWEGGVKPAHEPREQNGAVFFGGAGVEPVFFPGHAPAGAGPGGASLVPEYKRKPDPRKTGTVDWASRFTPYTPALKPSIIDLPFSTVTLTLDP
jgi:hypothetical protein